MEEREAELIVVVYKPDSADYYSDFDIECCSTTDDAAKYIADFLFKNTQLYVDNRYEIHIFHGKLLACCEKNGHVTDWTPDWVPEPSDGTSIFAEAQELAQVKLAGHALAETKAKEKEQQAKKAQKEKIERALLTELRGKYPD